MKDRKPIKMPDTTLSRILAAENAAKNKPTHTPGPLTVSQDYRGSWNVVDRFQRRVAEGIKSESDARLIAAAPSLLSALKAAHEYLAARDCGERHGTHAVLTREVAAAIAKAEGR